jgi:uncharacterized membrane protein YoaK (UPF0700 family)
VPVQYLSQLTDRERTKRANLHLGWLLAFVAGALNAGGFLAIGLYTSHMTGMVSMAADSVVLGQWGLAAASVLGVASFVAGAGSTALLINYTRRNWPRYLYLPSLLLEAALLLVFGLVGSSLLPHKLVSLSLTAVLLCYVMGLQNALITKISHAEIRTTHLTGLLTDVGIELGKLLYWNHLPDAPGGRVVANKARLRIHLSLVAGFLIGGVMGALGFKYVGFVITVPMALALVLMASANVFTQGWQPR